MYKRNQLNPKSEHNDTKNFIFPYKNNFDVLVHKKVDNNIEFDTNDNPINMSQFEIERMFNSISTDFFTEKVFTTQTTVLFQYFINNLFNKLVKYYRETNELNGLPIGETIDENDISFIYKGGTTMKILHDKFNIPTTQSIDYSDFFKRSDSDYTIFIDNKKFNFEQFMVHSKNLEILSFYGLIYIKKTIAACTNWFLDIKNIYAQKNIKELLDKYNNKITELNNTVYDPENSNIDEMVLKLLKDVKFVGIYIGKHNAFINKNEKCAFFNVNDIKQLSNLFNDITMDMFILKRNNLRSLGSTRRDFYIKRNNKTLNYFMFDNFNGYENNYDNMYISFNEDITGSDHTQYSGFSLVRSKYNITGIYKSGKKYGIINLPAELIDVSFSHYANKNITKLFVNNNFKDFITQYNYVKEPTFSYFSYTIIGFVYDLTSTIFEYKIPWFQEKYEKRLNRLMYFILLFVITNTEYNQNNYELGIGLFVDINNLFTVYPYTHTSFNLLLDNMIVKYDKTVLLHLLRNMQYLFSYADILDPMTNKSVKIINYIKSHIGKYNYFRNYIADLCTKNIEILKQPHTQNIDMNSIKQLGGYYDKYLKYKNKYMLLKNSFKIT
jgi:hypothetical protein